MIVDLPINTKTKMNRFTGFCEPLVRCVVTPLTRWISEIPFEQWPQQSRLEDGKIRPAMVTDLAWNKFGERSESLVTTIAKHVGGKAYQRMLSVVMPGHSIDAHKDNQESQWVVRVHVPLMTNEAALFIFDRWRFFNLRVGTAYRINTEALHEVRNDGVTPRIHLMFDVKEA